MSVHWRSTYLASFVNTYPFTTSLEAVGCASTLTHLENRSTIPCPLPVDGQCVAPQCHAKRECKFYVNTSEQFLLKLACVQNTLCWTSQLVETGILCTTVRWAKAWGDANGLSHWLSFEKVGVVSPTTFDVAVGTYPSFRSCVSLVLHGDHFERFHAWGFGCG